MTFEQIKLEIAKRLGDDDITRTRAVVGRAFEQAVTELALSDETRMEEIPDIIIYSTHYKLNSTMGLSI